MKARKSEEKLGDRPTYWIKAAITIRLSADALTLPHKRAGRNPKGSAWGFSDLSSPQDSEVRELSGFPMDLAVVHHAAILQAIERVVLIAIP